VVVYKDDPKNMLPVRVIFLNDLSKPKVEASKAKYSWEDDGQDHGTFCPANKFPGRNHEMCPQYVGLHNFLVLNRFKYVRMMHNMPRFAPASDDMPIKVVGDLEAEVKEAWETRERLPVEYPHLYRGREDGR
jgi:hypothetical protein